MAKKKPPLAEEALDRRSEDVVEVPNHRESFLASPDQLKGSP